MSTDQTRKIMCGFQKKADFGKIRVLKNPKMKQAPGWAIGLKEATGDLFIRVDAHAKIPKDFVEKSVACIASGEDVCGGSRPNILYEASDYGQLLLEAESSAFGSSIAKYRKAKTKSYVRSIFHGCLKREVIEKVGLPNEDLGRTEDNEFYYRVRKAGYKICMDPNIISYQHVRSTYRRMMKQKFGNGRWCSLTLGVCPKCLQVYHFIPGVAVLSFVGTALLAPWVRWPAKLVYGGYACLDLLMSVSSIAKSPKKTPYLLLLPLVFPSIHMAYGMGNIVGWLQLPSFMKKIRSKPAKMEEV